MIDYKRKSSHQPVVLQRGDSVVLSAGGTLKVDRAAQPVRTLAGRSYVKAGR